MDERRATRGWSSWLLGGVLVVGWFFLGIALSLATSEAAAWLAGRLAETAAVKTGGERTIAVLYAALFHLPALALLVTGFRALDRVRERPFQRYFLFLPLLMTGLGLLWVRVAVAEALPRASAEPYLDLTAGLTVAVVAGYLGWELWEWLRRQRTTA